MKALFALCAGAILAALPAAATVLQLPACTMDGRDQRAMSWDPDLTQGRFSEFTPYEVGTGFATWRYSTTELDGLVLQHCESGKYILAVAPSGSAEAMYRLFDDMMAPGAEYTLDQIGVTLADRTGAMVRRGEGDMGDCACNSLGY